VTRARDHGPGFVGMLVLVEISFLGHCLGSSDHSWKFATDHFDRLIGGQVDVLETLSFGGLRFIGKSSHTTHWSYHRNRLIFCVIVVSHDTLLDSNY